MEEVPRKAYIEEMKRLKHKNFSVTNCGLFISKDRYYISASPDGLVSCSCCGKGLYTSHGFHLERIISDFVHWQQFVEAADYFFVNYIAPKLLHL